MFPPKTTAPITSGDTAVWIKTPRLQTPGAVTLPHSPDETELDYLANTGVRAHDGGEVDSPIAAWRQRTESAPARHASRHNLSAPPRITGAGRRAGREKIVGVGAESPVLEAGVLDARQMPL